jgi:hypothetical protein
LCCQSVTHSLCCFVTMVRRDPYVYTYVSSASVVLGHGKESSSAWRGGRRVFMNIETPFKHFMTVPSWNSEPRIRNKLVYFWSEVTDFSWNAEHTTFRSSPECFKVLHAWYGKTTFSPLPSVTIAL